jgi:hypothetical protein
MNVFQRHPKRLLTRPILGSILGLVVANGCVAGRTVGSTGGAAPPTGIRVDAALAGEVLACAEQQFTAAGYVTHRDVTNPLGVQAQRETSDDGDAHEVNVASAQLRPVKGNPKEMHFFVSAETRMFHSRGLLAGYELRATARDDVVRVARSVGVTCGTE